MERTMKTNYQTPVSTVIQSSLPTALTQSGGFNFFFTNIQDDCCVTNPDFCDGSEGGGPPQDTPIPGLIEVSNGTFTIEFFNPGTNESGNCMLSGPIEDDGSISFDVDGTCFTDPGCPQEELGCCFAIKSYHFEGSFDGDLLTLHLTIFSNYDQNDPDCTIGPTTVLDCSGGGDLIGERT
jgi:hypothetical protein